MIHWGTKTDRQTNKLNKKDIQSRKKRAAERKQEPEKKNLNEGRGEREIERLRREKKRDFLKRKKNKTDRYKDQTQSDNAKPKKEEKENIYVSILLKMLNG